jgi:hypothetical protein
MFTIALGAWVARSTLDLWPLFAIALLLGFVGWAVDTPQVRARIGRPTQQMAYNRVYDEIRRVRGELKAALLSGDELGAPSEWGPQVLATDKLFWDLIARHYGDRERTLRANLIDMPGLLARDFSSDREWAESIRRVLLSRLRALDALSPKQS